MNTLWAHNRDKNEHGLMCEAFLHNAILIYRCQITPSTAATIPNAFSLTWGMLYRARRLINDELQRPNRNTANSSSIHFETPKLEAFANMLLDDLLQSFQNIHNTDNHPEPMCSLSELMVREQQMLTETTAARISWSQYRVDQTAKRQEAMSWINEVMDEHLERERTGSYWLGRTATPLLNNDVRATIQKYQHLKSAMDNHPVRSFFYSEQTLQQAAVAHARG